MFNNKLNKYINKLNILNGGSTNPIIINIKFTDPRRHENFTLTVNNTTTIFEIKDMILRRTNFNTYNQTLVHQARILDDTSSINENIKNNLLNYNISDNDTIYVVLGTMITVNIKPLVGETFSIRVNLQYDTPQDMKNMIETKLGKVIKGLIYKGRNLMDRSTNTIADWSIEDGDIINLINFSGGADPSAGGGGSGSSSSSASEENVNSEATPNQVVPTPVPVQAPRQRAAIFTEGPNPRLFVFDCDYTIWPFDCDGRHAHDVLSPFIRRPDGTVVDRYARAANPYPNVPYILGALYDAGIQVAFASRNPSRVYVRELLQAIPLQSQQPGLSLWSCLRGRDDLFHAYSSGGTNNKLRHFNAIKAASGLQFTDMVFFDDAPGNVTHAESISIISILLSQATGLTWDAIDTVVGRWRQRLEQEQSLAMAQSIGVGVALAHVQVEAQDQAPVQVEAQDQANDQVEVEDLNGE
jgi:magnesium-dependent phosphatase 1